MIEIEVGEVRDIAREIRLFEFRRPDGQVLPAAEAGCHIDLHLPDGMMRQYSLLDPDPTPASYRIAVKREPDGRGGSAQLFDKVSKGTRLTISAPRNTFHLDETAVRSVLIAGGIGITPIHAMSRRLRQLGQRWEMHYAARSRSDAAFLDEFEGLREFHFHCDEEQGGKVLDMVPIIATVGPGSHVYCCGPIPMMEAFTRAAAPLKPEQVHLEYFTAGQEAALEGGFVVSLARDGRSFPIPAGKTILEVLREAGIDVPASCEQGVCGTCETAVLEGVPDHRDMLLTPAEQASNRTMMICCSGSKTDKLVLDL